MTTIDMHCDTLLALYHRHGELSRLSAKGHVDLPRMRQGGIVLQFFALFPDLDQEATPLLRVMQLLDFFWQQVESNPGTLLPVLKAQDLSLCGEKGQIGALLSVEGGEALQGDLSVLRVFYRLGVRALGLTWNYRNDLADGVSEEESGRGLTSFGQDVVREMNQLGMVVDVAHLAERGVRDVLELSQAPVIASHANCRTVWGQRRNLSDSLIKGIAETGGVIGVTFVPDFVGARGAGLDDLVRHIDHLCELVGDDYIGFGSDFDGTARMLEGIPDVSHYPVLIERLRSMGYTEQSISKICRDNCLRVLQRILK